MTLPQPLTDKMSASAHTSISNLKAHQNKIAPNGFIKKEKVVNVGKKLRKRRGSVGSSINLVEPHNTSWIRTNIGMRECIRFTGTPVNRGNPDPVPDDPKCQCGKRLMNHDPRYRKNPDPRAKWKVETHTHTSATNAYGEIEFIGAAGAGLSVKLRKYIRVDYSIHPRKLMELLNDHWHLGTPKLLISVTGGARNFPMSNKLKNVFRKGLVKAAISTGAWIITGGTHAGVMKYVGEAVRDYALLETDISHNNVVAIGFASWGAIDQRDKLIDERGRFSAHYRMDTKKPSGVLLDPNHTHFILADNGTEGQFGVEIKLRAKMEKEISEQKMSGVANVSVPSVCVVVEGGPNTVATVYEAIMNGTPAVIVAGSGRAADILSFAFQRARDMEKTVKDSKGSIKKEKKTVISDALSVRIADMLSKEFGEKDLDIHLTRIKEMLKRRHLITVYELGTGSHKSDIDSAILHALLKANKGRVQDQLQLALIWNRVDVAKREIFTEDGDWKKGELDDALHYALVNNQVDFVKLFMENGISLKDYLTVRELTLLYNEVKPNTLLYELLDKARGKFTRKFTLIDVGKVLEELTMDTYEPLYIRNQSKYLLTEDVLVRENTTVSRDAYESGVCKGHVDTKTLEGKKETEACRKGDLGDHFASPVRELFLLAVMQNRTQMARMLWEDCNDAVASALTASMILKLMAEKENDIDQSNSMHKHANEYEELAIGVLNECYNDDPERTSILLVQEQDNWGKATSLSLAKHAQNKHFIAHSGVQNLLTEIWNGKLSDENPPYRLWLCTVFPFFIPFVIIFREDEGEEEEFDWKPNHEIDLNLNQGLPYSLEGDKLGDSLKAVRTEEPGSMMLRNVTSASNAALCDPDNDPESPEQYQETADIDIINSGKELTWWQRFTLFYDAPVITFRLNCFSFIIFLGLFSYIILANFTEYVSVTEKVLWVWVASLLTEELRQIAQGESNSWRIRFVSWISEYWNIADLATLILFAVGTALRFNLATLDIARIILALDLLIFHLRLLQIFSIHKNLGPKLIMIQRMMIDLLFFLGILLVFLLAFGIASQAILQPNSTKIQDVLTGVLLKPYFQIFGELFLDDILGNTGCTAANASVESGQYPCPVTASIGTLLLFFYMMLSNVLLLNLLIAMFSYTFSAVQENTDVYWRFQRHDLIHEYFSRPPLVPPFILISHAFLLIRFVMQRCFKVWLQYRSGEMKQRIAPRKVKQLVLWETIQSDEYIMKEKARLAQDINEQVKTTGELVVDLIGKMDELFADPETGMPSKALGLLGEKTMEDRLNRLEDQMERTNQAIDWVIMALSVNKLGLQDGPPELKPVMPRQAQENFDEEEEERKVPTTLEELGISLHQKARSSPYPGTAIRRFPVPDAKVPWENNYHGYKPVSYTHQKILDMPHYADIDLLKYDKNERPILNFNSYDKTVNHDRRSYSGHYTIMDGIPLNPRGRTGMIGRGTLGRFGPNHAADPIVTRWKKKTDGLRMQDDGLMVLEFIAIQRRDNQQWAIPGGMVEPGAVVSETLKREFGEEALGSLDKSPEEIAVIQRKIEDLFQKGTEVYRGYVDDPRNTDNAWMETVAMNFHDEDGTSVGLLELQAGDDAQGVRWQRVSSKIPLFASHQAMLRKVAELHNAAF